MSGVKLYGISFFNMTFSLVNARKPIHAMYAGPAHLAMEGVNGLISRMEVGSLGLVRV